MATEIALEVKVNSGSSVNAVKELKKEIRDLESLSLQAAEAGNNALARKYSAAAGAAKDKISDLKAEVGALSDAGSKLGTFTKVAAGIAQGFAAAQGAAALFGSSGKDLEKVLLKVQAASALAQGIQGIATLQEEFGRMKVVAINAFNGIKTAIGSTGIGLLVVALGAIYAYWDDIKAVVNGVSEEQNKLNEETNKNLKAQQDKLEAVSSQDNILKLQGKSEKDILEIKAKQTDEVIAASEIAIQNQKDTVAAQVEAAQRNKDILEGLLKFVSLPITAILKGIDLIGAAVGKNFGLEEKFFGGISSLLFDPESTKAEAEKTIAESQKALDKLKNDRAGLRLQINEIGKKEVEDKKQRNDELNKLREQQAKDFIARTESEYNQANNLTDQYYSTLITDAKVKGKEVAGLELESLQAKLQNAKDYGQSLIEIQNQIALKEKEIADNKLTTAIKGIEDEKAKKKLALTGASGGQGITPEQQLQLDLEADQKLYDLKLANGERDIALEQQIADRKIAIAQNEKDKKAQLESTKLKLAKEGLTAVADLVGSFQSKSVAGQKRAFQAQKAFSIGIATLDTFTAVASIFKNATLNPKSILFPGQPYVEAAIALTSGLARVNKIRQTTFEGGGGGGGSTASAGGGGGGSIATPNAPTIPTFNPQGTIIPQNNNNKNEAVKAYVLEDDVSSTQNRIRDIKTKALYG